MPETVRYEIGAWLNVGADHFFGFRATDPVAPATYPLFAGEYPLATDEARQITFVIYAASPEAAAHEFFAVGNKMGSDADGQVWPHDIRSLSVGDLIEVRHGREHRYLAVASVGWDEIVEPTNPRVALAGTDATTRSAS